MNSKEVRKTLDWMLAHGIITYSQYNELIIKSLPYAKG